MESPVRWESVTDRLAGTMRELFSRPLGRHSFSGMQPTWEALTRHYFTEELKFRSEVDSESRHIAKHGIASSNLSAGGRYYLCFRLQCAMDFIGMLFPPKAAEAPFSDIPNNWNDQRIIEWLLIDLWVRRHDHWLKLNAIGVYGPFAFYGIEPADPSVEA